MAGAWLPDGIERRHLRLVLAIGLALLFEEYDLSVVTAALHLVAHDLVIPDDRLAWMTALVRWGALPAFFVVPLADRVGRRPVFLASVVAMGAATFATAFVQTAEQWVALQMLVRACFVTGSAVGFVIVAEELPATARGWGIGIAGAISVCGHGVAAGLFAGVGSLPFGWRFLYAFGVVPVLLAPLLARYVPETDRYKREPSTSALASLRALASARPLRALGIAATGLLPGFGLVTAFQFAGLYTQRDLGWSPPLYSAMVIGAGALGILGNIVAGRLGDRIGRRAVGASVLILFPFAAGLFYWGPEALVPVAWVPLVFCATGGRTILRALSAEIFPTSQRAAASGLYNLLDTFGQGAGLFLLGWLATGTTESLATKIPFITLGVALGGLVVLTFPETKQRELESIDG